MIIDYAIQYVKDTNQSNKIIPIINYTRIHKQMLLLVQEWIEAKEQQNGNIVTAKVVLSRK